ncbi:MAG TPA: undecaprenyl-diphosphate phosphatase [Acidimicrobiales bacterium]|nr:undecaprenyl-diphosphate phosphatase [Acidimicrobiales bacterium]
MLASLTYFQAIVMGIIQGVTELFPVSSLGHGVLVPALFGWHNLVGSQSVKQSFFLVFLVGLHVGTALGLLVFYRRTWAALFRGLFTQLGRAREEGAASLWRLSDPSLNENYRLLVILAIGSVPVGVVGVVLESKLRELFAKPLAAAIFLVVNGLILLLGERLRRSRGKHARFQTVDSLTPSNALGVGSAQILALLAGISRSGVTMVAGLLSGLDHEGAANFSFLLATPVILLAGLYKLPELFGPLGHGVRLQTLMGALFAMVTAYVAVRFLTKWFRTRTLTPFAIYCLFAGALCAVRFA